MEGKAINLEYLEYSCRVQNNPINEKLGYITKKLAALVDSTRDSILALDCNLWVLQGTKRK